MKSKIAASLLVIALAAALMGGATFAYFTDTATNTGNMFSAGTLKINITQPAQGAAIFNVPNMYPGQAVTGYVYVKNAGSLPMKFWGSVTDKTVPAQNGAYLPDKLNVVVRLKGVNTGNGFDTRDQVIYQGTLAAVITKTANSGADNPLKWAPPAEEFGAGWEAKYEIAISFDPSAGNEYQGTKFTGNLTFHATQWNNPGWN